MEEKICEHCKKEKIIEGQKLCWDCRVKSKSQEQKLFEGDNKSVEMFKKIFGM